MEERFHIPEALFQPSRFKAELNTGIHQAIHQSVLKCDQAKHADLYNKIVLSGGNTMFEGLPGRLQKEMEKLAVCIYPSIFHLICF